jgi:hypothetical protein
MDDGAGDVEVEGNGDDADDSGCSGLVAGDCARILALRVDTVKALPGLVVGGGAVVLLGRRIGRDPAALAYARGRREKRRGGEKGRVFRGLSLIPLLPLPVGVIRRKKRRREERSGTTALLTSPRQRRRPRLQQQVERANEAFFGRLIAVFRTSSFTSQWQKQ